MATARQQLWSPTPAWPGATWAGGGLNLYDFVTYGTEPQAPPPAEATRPATSGSTQAETAFAMARAANVDTAVNWWLDVEPYGATGRGWSSNLAERTSRWSTETSSGSAGRGDRQRRDLRQPGSWNTVVADYEPPSPSGWPGTPGKWPVSTGARRHQWKQPPTTCPPARW